MTGVSVKNGAGTIHMISVIGQIEGHTLMSEIQKTTKYEHLIPELFAVEQSPEIGALLVILNTQGGDVEAGLALSELIGSMSKPTASLILGGGHSIGVPLAVAADRSFIVPTATMTIHPVRMNGVVLGVEQSFEYFMKMQDRIIAFISSHSSCPPDRLRSMLLKTDEIATDMGCIIDGEQAIAAGLIDSLGGISDAIDYLKKRIQSPSGDGV